MKLVEMSGMCMMEMNTVKVVGCDGLLGTAEPDWDSWTYWILRAALVLAAMKSDITQRWTRPF